jgi:YesN/AraC family two-component response regulator/phosphoribosylformylglycinamidine (FGAM) synthase PurS component
MQVSHNVEQSDHEIRNLCNSLFVNPKIARMMYGIMPEEDVYEWIQEFKSVCDPILLSNPLVESIYVYNRKMDHLFSSYRYLSFQDEELRTILGEKDTTSLLTPIVRQIDNPAGQDKKTKVITYILYDALDQMGKPDGAIIVNVNFDKFNDEIKQLITFSEEEKSKVFIYDKNGNIYFDQKEDETAERLKEKVQGMLDDFQIPTGDNFLLKTEKIMGEKYGIFFTMIPSMDWTIVKVQSYKDVFYNLNNQKRMIVVVSIIFSALILVLIYGLAQKIYSPINRLVQKVKGEKPGDGSQVNDILYLNRAYENLFQKARENQKKGPQNKIMLTYNLRSLLIDGKETDDKVLETLQAVDGKLFRRDNQFGVGILQIDNYQRFKEKYDRKDQDIYKYAIENILSEVLVSYAYYNVIIPVAEDKMAAIFHGNPADESEYLRVMENCFHTVNENVKKYFNISFSVSVSSYQKGIEQIHELYRRAENQLAYRYVIGKEAVILYDYKVEQVDNKDISKVMKQLNRHIQANNKNGVCGDFKKLTELVRQCNSDNLIEFVTGQVIQILHMIDVRERTNNGYGGNGFLERYTQILSLETWGEAADQLQRILDDVMTVEDKQTQKTKLLVCTIQKVVWEEYEDSNLSVSQIAEMVKMSSQYVGRIFRGVMGMSIADYINEYRLTKSIEIMMETGCTVSEVLDKVGIENESQYYRLFKKKYGTTPKAYILELLAGELD